jgi:hypothetical protein
MPGGYLDASYTSGFVYVDNVALTFNTQNAIIDRLQNGDFELGLDGWIIAGGSLGKAVVDTANYYSGTQSCKVTFDGVNYIGPYQDIPWKEGEVARFSAWVKTTFNGTHYASIQMLNAAKSSILAYTQIPVTADNTWRQVISNLEAPAGTAYCRVVAYLCEPNTTSGSAWVDLVSLERVEKLTGTDLARVNGILGLAGGSLSQEAKYGSNAKPLIIGSGAPSNGDGRADGSYYIDIGNSSRVYKKVAGAWTGLSVSDMVAGNFIGFTLTLNLNSVTTTINNAGDSSVPGGTIYPGLTVTNNSTGEYSYAAHSGLGVNIPGNDYYSLFSRKQLSLAYKSGGVGYPRILIDNSSASACGVAVYAPGASASAILRAQLTAYANYGTLSLTGDAFGAGLFVDGYQVVRGRQAAVSNAAQSTVYVNTGYSGYAGATFTATEQGYINNLLAFSYDTGVAISDLKSKLNSAITVIGTLIARLQTHGLIS